MKGILLLAIGSLGAAGAALGTASVITAAPASADVGCSPKVACDFFQDGPNTFVNGIATQPQQFQQSIQDAPGQFVESINPATAVDTFLNGDCANLPDECGILDQPSTFAESINPANQLQQFAGSILGAPGTFAQSIQDNLSALGPDNGPTSNVPGDEDP